MTLFDLFSQKVPMKKPLVPVAAMEQMQELPALTEGEMAEEFINLRDSGAQAEDAMNTLSQGARLVTALEGFADFLLDTMVDDEAQTWSPEKQSMIDMHLDQVYSGSGVTRPFELGIESMSGSGSLKQTIDTIKDHALRILKAIISAFKKAFEYLTDFVAGCVAYAARLATHARRLEMACRDLRDVRTSEIYEDKYLARQLYTPLGNLSATYNNVMELVYSAVRTANGPLITELEYLIREFKENKESHAMPDVAKVLEENYHSAFNFTGGTLPWPASNLDVPADCDVYETPIMFNGAVGVGYIPKNNEALHRFDFKIIDTGLYDKQTEGVTEVQVSSLSEIKTLLRQINQTCAGIHIFEREERKFASLRRDMENLTRTVENAQVSLTARDRDILKALSAISPKLLSGLHRATFSYALGASRQVLNHCRKSMSKYESKNELKN